jgi:hypothetical protein
LATGAWQCNDLKDQQYLCNDSAAWSVQIENNTEYSPCYPRLKSDEVELQIIGSGAGVFPGSHWLWGPANVSRANIRWSVFDQWGEGCFNPAGCGALSSGHVTFCILWVFPYYILLCFCILRCALGVRSIFRWSGLLVLLYSAVRTRCVQQFSVVASLTEMQLMVCLCFCILQCALGVRSIFQLLRV